MQPTEVLARLREEFNLPFFDVKVEDKTYSEEEYQQFKADLTRYFEEYVGNFEN